MKEIIIGDKLVKDFSVTEDMLACCVGSGTLKVYAIPMVAAAMENSACELAQQYLGDGVTTVGTMINIEHTAPTPLGAKVRVEAVLTAAEGRVFEFEITAYDECSQIAHATHKRVSVKSESFQKKADGRIEK